MVSSTGGTARILTNSGVALDDDDPSWSPDGDSIAFTRTAVANADIWIMDAPTDPATGGGGNQQQLTTAPSNEIQPNYSPAGTRLSYASDRHSLTERQIYSIATSGGAETRITSSATDDTWPATPRMASGSLSAGGLRHSHDGHSDHVDGDRHESRLAADRADEHGPPRHHR